MITLVVIIIPCDWGRLTTESKVSGSFGLTLSRSMLHTGHAGFERQIRDWSLITGKGEGYKMGKPQVRNF